MSRPLSAFRYMCLAISYLSLNYVRFILPTAPKRSVTYLDNKKMNSWFDIRGIRGRSRITEASENRTDLMESKERIDTIIAGEVQRGVPPERIFLLGFSQGGALALTAYLRSPFTLGGMLGIATWLPLGDEYPDRLSDKLVPGNIQLHHVSQRSACIACTACLRLHIPDDTGFGWLDPCQPPWPDQFLCRRKT